jgi:hypothetical protein
MGPYTEKVKKSVYKGQGSSRRLTPKSVPSGFKPEVPGGNPIPKYKKPGFTPRRKPKVPKPPVSLKRLGKTPNIVMPKRGEKGGKGKLFGIAGLIIGGSLLQPFRDTFARAKEDRYKKTFPSQKNTSGGADESTNIERPKLKAFKEAEVIEDTRAKKTGNRPTTGKSGDGPGPKQLKAPLSAMNQDSRLDFAKHNKSGSKLGMKMDDILRGAFSFLGTLPKSTDEDKWKNKK